MRVAVRDDGIGIEPADMAVIFDKFVQGDASASRRYNGSGLGLSLARELMELRGGTVEARSDPGAGSEFTAAFPVDAGRAVAEGDQEGEGRADGTHTAG